MVEETRTQKVEMVKTLVPIAELLWFCETERMASFMDAQIILNVDIQNQNKPPQK